MKLPEHVRFVDHYAISITENKKHFILTLYEKSEVGNVVLGEFVFQLKEAQTLAEIILDAINRPDFYFGDRGK